MAISKPLIRIYRPMLDGSPEEYLDDKDYAPDIVSLVHSYYLIEKDLKTLFDYVSPSNSNRKVFSHRIYELFFRSCTEFENNSATILNAHSYTVSGRHFNIKDYFKLNSELHLSDYQVRLNVWDNGPIVFEPFKAWNTKYYQPLTWYQDYNSVKHNRTNNFNLANLENLLNASAGLISILYAQIAYRAFSPYQPIGMTSVSDDFESANNSLFEVKPYKWPDTIKYDFQWSALKTASLTPFSQHTF